MVRATATGKVTGTVPVPKSANLGLDDPTWPAAVVDSSSSSSRQRAGEIQGQRLYRFRLTSTGQVTGFASLPGGTLSNRNWTADAIAASPDGSRVAISLSWAGPVCGSRPGEDGLPAFRAKRTVTSTSSRWRQAARSVWRGGTSNAFTVARACRGRRAAASWSTSGSRVHTSSWTARCARRASAPHKSARSTRPRAAAAWTAARSCSGSPRVTPHRAGGDQPGRHDDHRGRAERPEVQRAPGS